MTPLAQYLSDVQKTYAAKNATEHSYRAFLQTLLQSQMAGVVATNEPKRIACGAPDYVYKFLKDRKGRTLTYDERKTYAQMVSALSDTLRAMQEVDGAIDAAGGWPLR